MKEIDATQMRANLSRLTADRCRENATVSMITSERLFDEGDSAGALYWQQNATTWATLAQTCTPPEDLAVRPPRGLQLPGDVADREHECCHNSQRLPGARLLAAGDPEPYVNPGTLYVDPAGTGARFLLRIDGANNREWLWCDSLAQAEETLDEAVTWATAMGCGIIRVREATEREEVEFRNGTGGAALDLVRRLLGTLTELAHDHHRPDISLWLAECSTATATAFHTWLWPRPPEREDSEVTQARVRMLEQLANFVDPWKDLARWLRAVSTTTQNSEPWPDPYTFAMRIPDGLLPLTVRVEQGHSREDLQRLTLDTLGRLRTEVNAIIAERIEAHEPWTPGTRVTARVGNQGGEHTGVVVVPEPDERVPVAGELVYFRLADGELRWAYARNVRHADERRRAGTGGGAAQWREG